MVGPPPDSWAVEPTDAGARMVVPGLWRLRLPLPWLGIDHVNAYAVERDDGIMLVDCGSAGDPSCAAALDGALAQAGYTLADVRVLAATHVHSDHVGLARRVLDESGAALWAHPDDGHFYDAMREPGRVRAARERRARREGVPSGRLAAYADVREELEGAQAAVAPDQPLVEGARLASSLGDWEVIETPGHAPSHVCLLQRERGLAITGDLVCVVFVPWMDYGYSADPLAETLGSLDRLEGLGPLHLALPGHGRPLADVPRIVDGHWTGYAARLDAVRAALKARPDGGYALTTRVFGEERDFEAVGHLSEVLSHLAHLRRRGEAVRDEAPDGSYRYRHTGQPG